MEAKKPKGFGAFDALARKLMDTPTPAAEQVSACLAASVFLLTAEQLKELHDAIDGVASATGQDSFRKARDRLTAALRPERKRK